MYVCEAGMLSMGCVHINVVKHVEICTRVNMRLSIYLYNYLGGGRWGYEIKYARV